MRLSAGPYKGHKGNSSSLCPGEDASPGEHRPREIPGGRPGSRLKTALPGGHCLPAKTSRMSALFAHHPYLHPELRQGRAGQHPTLRAGVGRHKGCLRPSLAHPPPQPDRVPGRSPPRTRSATRPRSGPRAAAASPDRAHIPRAPPPPAVPAASRFRLHRRPASARTWQSAVLLLRQATPGQPNSSPALLEPLWSRFWHPPKGRKDHVTHVSGAVATLPPSPLHFGVGESTAA